MREGSLSSITEMQLPLLSPPRGAGLETVREGVCLQISQLGDVTHRPVAKQPWVPTRDDPMHTSRTVTADLWLYFMAK